MEFKFENAIKEFKKYLGNFDINNSKIAYKYDHTFRVVDYAKEIALSENLNEHDYYLALVCALVHDIGRFDQVKEFASFLDGLSFDHGDKGFEILQNDDYISNYVSDEEDKNIVLKSVKNHNKFAIEEGLTNRELYFAKLVRDADKIDIMDKQGNIICDNVFILNDELMNAVNEKRLVKIDKNVKRKDIEKVISTMCFKFDVCFNKSLQIIAEKNLIENKLAVLENCITEEEYNIIKKSFE